jgi:hypothetical protein
MGYTILALDPFILRALCSSANLAGIQAGRNVLNDALADALQQASKFVSLLIVHGMLASKKPAQFKQSCSCPTKLARRHRGRLIQINPDD